MLGRLHRQGQGKIEVDRRKVRDVGGYHSTTSQRCRNLSTVSVRGNAEFGPNVVNFGATAGQRYW
jgi:hypothetical protein